MKKGFPAVLSRLRREKGVNQRAAAAALNISQALLSHYENGLREPGLEFLTRACDYYGVSADFLLGRTEDRNAARIPGGEGSPAAMCCAGVTELFVQLDENGDETLCRSAADAVAVTVYRLSRIIGEDPGCVLTEDEALPLCTAAAALDEFAVRERVEKSGRVRLECAALTETAESRLLGLKNPAETGV